MKKLVSKNKSEKGYNKLFQSDDGKDKIYYQMNAMNDRILRDKQRRQ